MLDEHPLFFEGCLLTPVNWMGIISSPAPASRQYLYILPGVSANFALGLALTFCERTKAFGSRASLGSSYRLSAMETNSYRC